jgi:hypothetical protein
MMKLLDCRATQIVSIVAGDEAFGGGTHTVAFHPGLCHGANSVAALSAIILNPAVGSSQNQIDR